VLLQQCDSRIEDKKNTFIYITIHKRHETKTLNNTVLHNTSSN